MQKYSLIEITLGHVADTDPGSIHVLLGGAGMKRDGWIVEKDGVWILRFKYDWESWDQNPKVWIDKGRLQSSGIPLLTNRRRMRRVLAIMLWRELLATGWRRIDPQWD